MSDIKAQITRKDIWQRALYMVLFAFAYGIAEVVITFLVIFQFLSILFTGRANEPLLKFGSNLSAYIFQILRFQTFNTEDQPFPFSAWPEEEAGGERWVEENSASDDSESPLDPTGQ